VPVGALTRLHRMIPGCDQTSQSFENVERECALLYIKHSDIVTRKMTHMFDNQPDHIVDTHVTQNHRRNNEHTEMATSLKFLNLFFPWVYYILCRVIASCFLSPQAPQNACFKTSWSFCDLFLRRIRKRRSGRELPFKKLQRTTV
jgi:hypothetical protein